jgi:glycosyltransferase involved in cell wall biosynthesis
MNVLHLLTHLEYHGSTKESSQLARHAPTGVNVVCLGKSGPAMATFQRDGTTPTLLGWTRIIDPTPLWRLRTLLRERAPDLIHVWDLRVLRTLALVSGKALARTVVSLPSTGRKKLGALDRWLLNQSGRLLVRSEVEGASWTQLGVASSRITVVTPGVEPRDGDLPRRTRRRFLSIGPLTAAKGHRVALFALDLLSHATQDVELEIVGEGPYRRRLEELQSCQADTSTAHFTGHVANLNEALDRADVVWAPSLGSGATHAVLEAMAAGRPVIASAWPHFADLVCDGITGHLVPAGDHLALARRTWHLLNDSARLKAMGDAARRRSRDLFPVERYIDETTRAYRTV